MKISRKFSAVGAVVISISIVAAVIFSWMNWNWFWHKPFAELVAWALPFTIAQSFASTLAFHAWTGEWVWGFV